MRRRIRALALAIVVLCGVGGDALAVVGRPLTPMSYAGVARRTARRTSYAYAATRPYAYGYAPYATGAYVTSVPGSCSTYVSSGVAYQNCGGATYRPYYQGTTVVYREID